MAVIRTNWSEMKMNSQASNSETSSFLLLDERIQRWIWSHGWTSLRAVQELAIPALLPARDDVILAAATSAGKTEAAFFPILTRLLQLGTESGFVLSISPLKALINDQTQRLSELCELLDLPVLGWHGDVPASRKQKFLKAMSGVLIITPESLEALFVNKGTTIPALAGLIRYIVVDELHSFIGTERGKQVQSLMTRMELAAGHTIPRVGLSATLGDKLLAAEFLRPGGGKGVRTIDAAGEGYDLKLIVKGYADEWIDEEVPTDEEEEGEGEHPSNLNSEPKEPAKKQTISVAKLAITKYLYTQLRGTNNLIFPNSRSQVEYYADQLRRQCERDGVPNEFWTHHGSLSRELREESEAALKSGVTAATAICTNTLELGIDIGNIKSVVQIGPPPSVASLRQRLGRSGRRAGESAILRCLSVERKLTAKSSFSDQIREGLLQTIAMVQLLLNQWVEPPRRGALHASTLVQQILSVIAQRGGATAEELWTVLAKSNIFENISREEFVGLLRALGSRDILQQESAGLLLPGVAGEELINHYDFYSAFASGEEFRLLAEGRVLGSLPVNRPLTIGQCVIFGGRRWRVRDVDTKGKVVFVSADRGGSPPVFDGTAGSVDDRVRQEMRSVLAGSDPVSFLDPKASELLEEARLYFQSGGLGQKHWFVEGHSILILTWRGDWANDAISLLLTAKGLATSNEGIALRVSSVDQVRLKAILEDIAASTSISIEDLRLKPEHTIREKWDWVLPDSLRLASFASSRLDLGGARTIARELTDGVQIR
jgi:ATP-dependent helicase Lhr and Lhr-like helicase